MTTKPLKLKTVNGKVDFAVITIRTDEYEAVLESLTERQCLVGNGTMNMPRSGTVMAN